MMFELRALDEIGTQTTAVPLYVYISYIGPVVPSKSSCRSFTWKVTSMQNSRWLAGFQLAQTFLPHVRGKES